MREKMKRLTAALCAVVLAAALLPGAVWAEELTAAPAEEPSQAPAEVQAAEEETTAVEAVEEETEDAVPETAVWLRSDPTTHELVEVDLPDEAIISWEELGDLNIAAYAEGDESDWLKAYFDKVTVPRYGEKALEALSAQSGSSVQPGGNRDARSMYGFIRAWAVIAADYMTPSSDLNGKYFPYSFQGDNYSIQDAKLAMHAFIADYPEMFWAQPIIFADDDTCYGVGILFNSHYAEDFTTQRAAFLTKVDDILAGMPDGSDYEKELYLHDTLIKNVIYDRDYAEEQNAYSALVNGRAVCAGYASAFEYLLMRAGIESYYVVGKSHGVGHAWNLAKIGGQWYYVDPTWNDPQMKDENQNLIESPYSPHYAYFNITTEMLTQDHDLSGQPENVPLPECNSINAFYFNVNHTMVSANDPMLLYQVCAALWRNNGEVRMYTANGDSDKLAEWYYGNLRNICDTIGVAGINGSCAYGGTEFILFLNIQGTFPALPTPGQLNNDSEINITDVQALYSYLTTDTTPQDTPLSGLHFYMAADVNEDHSVDVYDLQTLYEIVNKIR